MSRVGRTIINIPDGVKFEIIYGYDKKRMASVTGKLGVLVQEIKDSVWIVENKEGEVLKSIELKRENDENKTKALHGLYNRLIHNMVKGVSEGFSRYLFLNGVGYKVAPKGTGLTLNLGTSHSTNIDGEEGITMSIMTPAEVQAMGWGKEPHTAVLKVFGASKERVGMMASKIRDLRPVEPYHLYGVRYSDERVIRKESKSGAKKKK
jgi:large subunit ribosomal protein L6